ncbi:hypothetical protein FOA52_015354 [Chlamydomonas sp. UWO 241]|nr:hypothetical protein FOA52_015354 [Chlamydomonas sp. UWO 241]
MSKGMGPGFDTTRSLRDRELFSTFREEPSIAAGDPYKEANPIPERFKGKQFAAPFMPQGTGMDAMIDKTTPLTIPGDVYLDPHVVDRMRSQNAGKPITDKAFKPVGTAPKSPHAGSTFGLIGDPMLDTCPTAAAQTSSTVKALGLKNLYVQPAKKGTYDSTHMPDAYDPGSGISRSMRQAARAKIGKPFVSSGRTGRGIVPVINNMGAGGEIPKQRAQSAGSATHAKPWRSAPPTIKGKGDFGCINKTEYVSGGYVPVPKPSFTKPFKPSGGTHERLSMWSVNHYAYEGRPAPNNDLSLLR